TGMGMASVLMIGMLSYFLYSTLSEHISASTREYLSKEAQLASSDVQREFSNLREDLSYYASRISENDGRLDDNRILRLLNKYPIILDTLFLQSQEETIYFTFDDSDSLVCSAYVGKIPEGYSSNHLSVSSNFGDATLVAKVNLSEFFREVTTPYFASGTKYFYENGKLFDLN